MAAALFMELWSRSCSSGNNSRRSNIRSSIRRAEAVVRKAGSAARVESATSTGIIAAWYEQQ
jgi:hypothetical protein